MCRCRRAVREDTRCRENKFESDSSSQADRTGSKLRRRHHFQSAVEAQNRLHNFGCSRWGYKLEKQPRPQQISRFPAEENSRVQTNRCDEISSTSRSAIGARRTRQVQKTDVLFQVRKTLILAVMQVWRRRPKRSFQYCEVCLLNRRDVGRHRSL